MSVAAPLQSTQDPKLQAAYVKGRRAHPRLDLDPEDYLTEAVAERPPRSEADYYLARACNAGVPGSWERLQMQFRRRLRGFLRKRGASASDADQLLDEAWGALAEAPPRGGARTRIGTYDGRGSLHAWLATILWRRLTDLWRKRPAATAESAEEQPAPQQRDPAVSVSHDETSRLLADALEEAWSTLTPRELQAVVLKYCHKLPQTEIARIMNVGAPRVTRMLQSATSRLRSAIASRFDRHTDWDVGGSGWAALAEAVERMLSRSAAQIGADVDAPEEPRRTADG